MFNVLNHFLNRSIYDLHQRYLNVSINRRCSMGPHRRHPDRPPSGTQPRKPADARQSWEGVLERREGHLSLHYRAHGW